MRQIGKHQFPENSDEAKKWERYVRVRAFGRTVLVYAHTRIEGKWKAYIKDVPGQNHDHEWQEVKRHGAELPADVALAMFPEFEGVPYAK